MKNLSVILPPPAPDYGGICAAMYELGGLVVIHDASGCTINYTTYDEPRWLRKSSHVYCSGLQEVEAVMGDDKIVINKVLKAAKQLSPAFIAIVGSSVPMLIGADIAGIAAELEDASGLPCFGFPASGIGLYDKGASAAFVALLKRFARDGDKRERGINLLGMLPMDYNSAENALGIKKRFCDAGYEVIMSLSMDCSLTDIVRSPAASLNIVASSSGIPAAQYMKSRYGIPYITGIPLGDKQQRLLFAAMSCASGSQDYMCEAGGDCLIAGEYVTSLSLSSALFYDYGVKSAVLNLYSPLGKQLRAGDLEASGEQAIAELLNSGRYKTVVGDNCLGQLINSQGVKFIPLPSVAMSGGIFSEQNSMFLSDGLAEIAKQIVD